MLRRTILALSAAVLAPVLFGSREANAANRFEMMCIESKTRITINYTAEWASFSRTRHSLGPGQRTSHTWEYQRGRRAPTLFISFDDDLSAQVRRRIYYLRGYASPQRTDCVRYGMIYEFRYDGSARQYIDLVRTNR
jgi:hypothetical protein